MFGFPCSAKTYIDTNLGNSILFSLHNDKSSKVLKENSKNFSFID